MKKLAITITVLLLTVSVTLAQQERKSITIAAGSTATDLIVTPVRDSFEKASGIRLLSLKLPGKNAVAALGKGDVQAVLTDATLESITADIKAGAIPFPDPTRLKSYPVLATRSIVVVHRDNPVTALNKEQLKAVFSGKTLDWQAVGGNSQMIVVAIAERNKGTLAEFNRKIMDNEPLLKDPVYVTDDNELKAFVAATPEAIGVLPSMAMVDATVKSPATPDISKTVHFFCLGEPAGEVKTLLDYLTGAGQSLFKKYQ